MPSWNSENASSNSYTGEKSTFPIEYILLMSFTQGKFTSKSDVWSFAVTLWEILTFAREQPFEELSDNKVIENLTHFYENDGNQVSVHSQYTSLHFE